MPSLLPFLFLTLIPPLTQDPNRFDMGLFESPSLGETPSKGEYLIYHKGEGKPGKGYFKKHEPGEIAEFHLFVPEAANPQSKSGKKSKRRRKSSKKNKGTPKKCPLIIVYHGGKDGGSGKGLAKKMSRLSTKEHPLIVLSPNMYTVDSYKELIAEGKYPIDENLVFVMGFSSGGMGVLSAMKEGGSKDSGFRPQFLASMSTTASYGRNPYPEAPYYVVAGERETAEYVKHPLLKTRRKTCRRHAIGMQQVIKDVSYVEVPGKGHSCGSPLHMALLQNLIRSIPVFEIDKSLGKVPEEFRALADLGRAGRWEDLAKARQEAEGAEKKSAQRRFHSFDRKLMLSLRKWLESEVKTVVKLKGKGSRLAVTRVLNTEPYLPGLLKLFEGHKDLEKLEKALSQLDSLPWWQRELEARKQYREIASSQPGESSKEALQKLRKEFKGTVFGDHRAQQMLLAYEL